MKTISIRVGTKTFSINCPEGQEDSLEQATKLLDTRFEEIRQNASTLPYDQTLVLAALNSIVSYQNKIDQQNENNNNMEKRLKRIITLFD